VLHLSPGTGWKQGKSFLTHRQPKDTYKCLYVDFESQEHVLAYILKGLLIYHHPCDILRHFQLLLGRDIEKSKKLSPRLKQYFRMAKMQIKRSLPPSQEELLKEKCKDLSLKEREKAVELMRQKRVLWVENDFVFVVK
jgi:hypothetical protein